MTRIFDIIKYKVSRIKKPKVCLYLRFNDPVEQEKANELMRRVNKW